MFFSLRKHEAPAMTLEGVLGPNSRLDEAAGMKVDAPHALCVDGRGRLLFSSRGAVLALPHWGAEPARWLEFGSPVTALAASPGGLVAVGLTGGRLAVCDGAGNPVPGWTMPSGVMTVADLAFASDDELVVVDNGYGSSEAFMSVAPWDDAGRGRVVAVSRSQAPKVLAEGLHCPMGIARDGTGEWMLSLFERAAIVGLAGDVKQGGYPAYPGRIRRTAAGYVMACLTRRDPLIEFLKTEKDFVAEMKSGMEPRHWIAPRASPEFSHDFPIELGSTRLFGEIKPWAPSFSYGLVIALDDELMPVASFHSRANGLRHEISDALVWNGDLIAVSRASGEILNAGAGGLAA